MHTYIYRYKHTYTHKTAFTLVDRQHRGRIDFGDFCEYNGLKLTKSMIAKLLEIEQERAQSHDEHHAPECMGTSHVCASSTHTYGTNPLTQLAAIRSASERRMVDVIFGAKEQSDFGAKDGCDVHGSEGHGTVVASPKAKPHPKLVKKISLSDTDL
jgi:hypothetical protein